MKFWSRIFRRATPAPRPVVFVDIDGVLAPMAMRDGLEVAQVGGWQGTVVYDPAVIAYLRRWHQDGLAEVRWLTSWDDDANTCFAPAVGLPEFFVHPEPVRADPGRGWWKEAVVSHHIRETPRRVVWLEDEVAVDSAAHRLAATDPDHALIIVPDSRTGLTIEDCHAVERFLRHG